MFKWLFKRKPKCEHDFKCRMTIYKAAATWGWRCCKCNAYPKREEMEKLLSEVK